MARNVLVVCNRDGFDPDDEGVSVITRHFLSDKWIGELNLWKIGGAGMRVLDLRLSVRGLPLSRSLVLTVMAMLLAAADWLPENPLVDSDYVEFLLSSAFGISANLMPQSFWRTSARGE